MADIHILAVDGGLYSSITALHDAFFIAELWHRELKKPSAPLFNTRILTMDGRPVTACGGFTVQPHIAMEEVRDSDYVIVAPLMPHLTDMPGDLDRLREWLLRMMGRDACVATICTGSFILAEMGLLDGRRATTNWQFARMFRRKYPRVVLEPEEMLVQDGPLITTGAVTSVYGLILHMINRIGSPELAAVVSKALLIEGSRRDQTPYTMFSPIRRHGDEQVLRAQAFIETEYARIESIDTVAREVGVSPRHFIRRFKQATGEPPLKYLQQVRVQKAKERLETTADTVEEITWAVGYRDISSFGRLFKQHTRLSPKAYRDKFSLARPAAQSI